MQDEGGDSGGRDGANSVDAGDKRDALEGAGPTPEELKGLFDVAAADPDTDALLVIVAATQANPPHSKGNLWFKDGVNTEALLDMVTNAVKGTDVPEGTPVN